MEISDNDINPNLPREAPAEEENSMAVLNAFGGGDVDPEGQPLGLDPDGGKAKLSGSTLAVAVVVVVGIGTLAAMKMTLKAVASDSGTAEAIQLVEDFMIKIDAAEAAGVQGPIEPINGDSSRIISELEADPTEYQVPSEEVQKNPFQMVGLPTPPSDARNTDTGPTAEELEAAELERLKSIVRGFTVDSITGTGERAVVFIDGDMYRVGQEIAGTGFTVAEVDGLDVIIRAPLNAPKPWAFRIRYE